MQSSQVTADYNHTEGPFMNQYNFTNYKMPISVFINIKQ